MYTDFRFHLKLFHLRDGGRRESNLVFLWLHHTSVGSLIAISLTRQISMYSPYFSLHMTGLTVLTQISTFLNLLILFPGKMLIWCVSPLSVSDSTWIIPYFCVLFFLHSYISQRLSCFLPPLYFHACAYLSGSLNEVNKTLELSYPWILPTAF